MKRRTLLKATASIPLASMISPAWAKLLEDNRVLMAFASGGSKKMLYDVRQRPQALYWNGKVYIGYKGGGTEADKSGRRERVAPTHCPKVGALP